jgi:hypothetical protein
MAADELSPSLQESILAALIFDEKAGAAIAIQVLPRHFDENYRPIAERVLGYRRKYGRGPGRQHLDDLFGKLLHEGRTPRLRRVLFGLAELAEGLNGDYVVARTQDFVREQQLKAALIDANSRFEQGGEGLAPDIEGIFGKALRYRAQTLDAGTFLSDTTKSLKFLDRNIEGGISLGIRELDRIGVQLMPGELLLYIGAKGCLVGETLVDCPRDLKRYPRGIPLKNLVGKKFLTYSWDTWQNKLVLSRVLDVWKTGERPVYRVVLTAYPTRKAGESGRRNGGKAVSPYLPPTELIGTYDHPVLLCDGTWKKLGELTPGSSLKSLYRGGLGSLSTVGLRVSKEKPTVVSRHWYWTSKLKTPIIYHSLGSAVEEHRFVCAAVNGPCSAKFHAHHKDRNSYNNTPDNLEWLSAPDHASHHLRLRNLEGTAGWKVSGVHPRGMKDKTHSSRTKKRQQKASKQLAVRRRRDGAGRFVVDQVNHKVVSVEYLGVRPVYDMEVENTSNFVANGVFVHNSGKTWACIHVGKQALVQRKKVLHISNEVDEDVMTGRYYQALFAASTRPDKYDKTFLEFDKLGRLAGFRTRKVSPKWDFSAPSARRELRKKLQPWGTRLGRLCVKRFPSGSLTMSQLEAYLDFLESEHKFIPQVLIIDYPDLMAQDVKNYRISLGRTFVDIRGLLGERSIAGFTPTQGNRASIKASRVSSDMVAEDITKVNTADNVLTYSRTEAEKRLGLARLHVAHARNGRDGDVIIITQSYTTGQYVLDSALMQQAYWTQLEGEEGDDDE